MAHLAAIYLFLLLAILPSANGASAVGVAVLNTSESFRSGAPATLRLQIENRGSGIRDGVLETMISGTMVPLICETPMVLAPGTSQRNLLVPYWANSGGEISVRFRFVEKEAAIEAGVAVFPPGIWARSHLILVATSAQRQSVVSRFLQLERLSSNLSSVRTSTARLAADELPQNPLAYLPYDVVVLDHATLSSAREKALVALAQWVDAGGSVLVQHDATLSLPEAATAFLARLRIDDPGQTSMLAPGLGRAVVWEKPIPTEGDPTPEWDAAAMWLWKTTPELLAPTPQKFRYPDPGNSRPIQAILTKQLAGNAGPIAFEMIVGLFTAFVVLAAAFDYFVLGRRFRKFTWIIFPLQCAGFAWALMAFVNHRIGVEERSASIVLTDIGFDGRVLRVSKITGYLPGNAGIGEHRSEGALPNPHYSNSQIQPDTLSPPRFRGNPGGAMTTQTMTQKWTPCFYRDTSIPGTSAVGDLPWGNSAASSGYKITRASSADVRPERPNYYYRTDYMPLEEVFLQKYTDWNRSEPVSQYSPTASPYLDDLNFPIDVPGRHLILAVKTVGNTTHIFRKLSRAKPPQ